MGAYADCNLCMGTEQGSCTRSESYMGANVDGVALRQPNSSRLQVTRFLQIVQKGPIISILDTEAARSRGIEAAKSDTLH